MKNSKVVSTVFMVSIVLSAAQLASAPAHAADLDGRSPFAENQRGAFAGLRLRAETGTGATKLRAGLALAPTAHVRRGANSKMAVGEGMELRLGAGMKAELTLAGQRMDRMSLLGDKQPKRRANMSDAAKVALGVGGLVVVAGIAYVAWMIKENGEPHD
jgi:hypothetical protein